VFQTEGTGYTKALWPESTRVSWEPRKDIEGRSAFLSEGSGEVGGA
jgi:hypothetical protein